MGDKLKEKHQNLVICKGNRTFKRVTKVQILKRVTHQASKIQTIKIISNQNNSKVLTQTKIK